MASYNLDDDVRFPNLSELNPEIWSLDSPPHSPRASFNINSNIDQSISHSNDLSLHESDNANVNVQSPSALRNPVYPTRDHRRLGYDLAYPPFEILNAVNSQIRIALSEGGHRTTLIDLRDRLHKIETEVYMYSRDEDVRESTVKGRRNKDILNEATRVKSLLDSKLDEVSHSMPRENRLDDQFNVRPRHTTMLKKFELPTFCGDIFEYRSFMDLFTNHIINRSDLDDVTKLTYLRMSLKDEALQLIKNVPCTNEGFTLALTRLKETYDNPVQIKSILFQKFRSISPPKMELYSLRQFRLEIEGLYLTFGQVCDPESNLDALRDILNKKLSIGGIFREVRLKLTASEYSIHDLLKVIRLFEDIEAEKFDYSNFDKSKVKTQPNPRNSPSNTCIFCKGSHNASFCGIVTSPDARRSVLMREGACFVCLRRGHNSGNCRSNIVCSKCKLRHHTSICKDYESFNSFQQSNHMLPIHGRGNNHRQINAPLPDLSIPPPNHSNNNLLALPPCEYSNNIGRGFSRNTRRNASGGRGRGKGRGPR
ncbi:MAG: DUF1759 domain-containing protein [Cyanobacteria bacterium J06649_11]